MNDETPGPGHDDTVVNGAPLGGDEDVQKDLEWPIGFMIVVALAALYIIWRIVQLVGRGVDFIG